MLNIYIYTGNNGITEVDNQNLFQYYFISYFILNSKIEVLVFMTEIPYSY